MLMMQACSEKIGIQSIVNTKWVLTEWPNQIMPNTEKKALLNFGTDEKKNVMQKLEERLLRMSPAEVMSFNVVFLMSSKALSSMSRYSPCAIVFLLFRRLSSMKL